MTGSPTVERVLRDDLCSGCGLCAGISGGAIVMGVEAPGYNRPHVVKPVSAAVETVIAECCPGSRVAPWRRDVQDSPYWGPAEAILNGYECDAGVRFAGSSGGALTAMLSLPL